jgi:hypothetical protein
MQGTTEYEVKFNQFLEEQTAILVKLERATAWDSISTGASYQEIAEAAAEKRAAMTRYAEVSATMEVLRLCVSNVDTVAQKAYTEHVEKGLGKHTSEYAKRLFKKAKLEVKEDEALKTSQAAQLMVQGLGQMNQALSSLPNALSSLSSSWSASAGNGNSPGRDKGKGKGDRGGRRDPTSDAIRLVDGAVYNAALAGKMAPHPSSFPRDPKLRFDADNAGITNLFLSKTCNSCHKTGHISSECPANKWIKDGKDTVNHRWLWENGYCQANGTPKQ